MISDLLSDLKLDTHTHMHTDETMVFQALDKRQPRTVSPEKRETYEVNPTTVPGESFQPTFQRRKTQTKLRTLSKLEPRVQRLQDIYNS